MLTSIYHLFPRTIHPMVIHFTIAFIYLTALFGIAAMFRRKDAYFTKSFFLMICLSIVATLAAGVAGVISESYVGHIPHGVRTTFETHKDFGVLTGVLMLIAFALQSWKSWKERKIFGMSIPALIIVLLAVVTVSIAGHFGGDAVYNHGLGVVTHS